jgi:hypothetical protein
MRKSIIIPLSTALAMLAFSILGGEIANLKASDVFDRHFAAVGGRAAAEQVQTMVIKGTVQEGGATWNAELDLKLPGRILFITAMGDDVEVRQGRSGNAKCWRKDASGISDANPQDAGELMNLAIAFFPPSQLFFSERLKNAVCVEEAEGDRTLIGIGRKGADSVFARLQFDKQSGLLARVGTTEVADFREVKPIKLPFEVRKGGQFSFKVAEIQVNAPLDDARFEKPQGLGGASNVKTGRSVEYQTLTSRPGQLEIVRRPATMLFGRGELKTLPHYNPKSSAHGQVDLRSYDLRKLDLSQQLANLLHADFDSRTKWPDRLPDGYDKARIQELGKDPGLGVCQLHERGITGQGIGIGIIDQPLLVDHMEYKDRLRMYEEVHEVKGAPAQMHGPAVASIAVGKTVGVAPAADLYYIAEEHIGAQGPGGEWDFTWLAQAIHRMLDVNDTLPASKKIRVISISVGWSSQQKGYAETMKAVERANKAEVFIVSTAIEETHHLAFHGLGREALAEPNQFSSYGPGSWWANGFWDGMPRLEPSERLLVPMDCRCLASPTGANDYVFYWSSGWSWSVPWISGLYALACQVKPDVTPQQFWSAAMKTGRVIQLTHDSEKYQFGTIADPVALIESLKKGVSSE